MLTNLPETVILDHLTARLRVRLAVTHRNQAGYSTEAVIVTALLVALAITAVAIIAAKVINAAKGIQTR
jgi:hypothetical protein